MPSRKEAFFLIDCRNLICSETTPFQAGLELEGFEEEWKNPQPKSVALYPHSVASGVLSLDSLQLLMSFQVAVCPRDFTEGISLLHVYSHSTVPGTVLGTGEL